MPKVYVKLSLIFLFILFPFIVKKFLGSFGFLIELKKMCKNILLLA